MQCWFVGLLSLFTFSTAQAQTFYVGGSLALLTDGRYSSPFIGAQVGGELVENLELRATFETQLYASRVSADLLYRFPLGEGFSTYVGAGPEVLFLPLMQPTLAITQVTSLGSPNYAFHGTLGLEARPRLIGFFGEVQPTLTLSPTLLGSAKFRAGLNFYF